MRQGTLRVRCDVCRDRSRRPRHREREPRLPVHDPARPRPKIREDRELAEQLAVGELLSLQEHGQDAALAEEHERRLPQQPVVERLDDDPRPRGQLDDGLLCAARIAAEVGLETPGGNGDGAATVKPPGAEAGDRLAELVEAMHGWSAATAPGHSFHRGRNIPHHHPRRRVRWPLGGAHGGDHVVTGAAKYAESSGFFRAPLIP